MSDRLVDDTAEGSPRPKLRPTAGRPGGPGGPGAADGPTRAGDRAVPVRVLLLAGLAVLLALAAWRPGGVSAAIGVPLALVLPGAVLQPRFLPGLRTDPVTTWSLRTAISLGGWALVALGVGAAGIPVRSVWTVVVAVLLLAAVVVGDPDRGVRYGAVPVRRTVWGVVAVIVAAALALGARGLVALADDPAGAVATGPVVVVGFADPGVPLALAATGATATVQVRVTNSGDRAVTLEVGGQVGRALPWTPVSVRVPAGGARTVEVGGVVPVCSSPQQAIVTVEGAGVVSPLSTVVPGAAGGIACGSG